MSSNGMNLRIILPLGETLDSFASK